MQREEKLTVSAHLLELRSRLIKSVIAVGAGIAITFPLTPYIFRILESRAGDIDLIFIHVTEMIGTYMKVSLYCGIALALPYLIYHLVMFISPALRKSEKKYVYLCLPIVAILFAAGVCFAYFIFLPPAIKFLLTFGGDIAMPMITIGNYVSLVTRLLLAVGLIFEIPLVITLLAKLGIVSPQKLARWRKWALLIAFIAAAIITPTIDPLNQTLLALPIIALYEMSIWLSKLVYPRKAATVSSEATDDQGPEVKPS
ncbi:MAG: twin-arginine translocase subunit TatC [Dehalococcoidia bacterium]|nr:twin-arginine translocase subunit TatC [Dehalococcoidia bacterium]